MALLNMKTSDAPRRADEWPTEGVGRAGSGAGRLTDGSGAFTSEKGREVERRPKLTLTVEEAARLLGISRALAYELVTRDELPHLRLGRRIVVPRRALESMLDGTN